MDPYKAFASVNSNLVPKRSLESLTIRIPYLVKDIIQAETEYGACLKVYFRDPAKKTYFSYLPPRFSKQLSDAHIQKFLTDIKTQKPPFLVFKGKHFNAFDVTLLPFHISLARKALTNIPLTEKELKSFEPTQTESQEPDEFEWLEKVVSSSFSGDDDSLNADNLNVSSICSQNLKRPPEATNKDDDSSSNPDIVKKRKSQ